MIYAVDPGGVTGVAVYNEQFNAPALKQYDNWIDAVEAIAGVIWPEDWLVVERFDIRPGVRSQQLDPIYAIGALQYVTRVRRNRIVLQTPAQAKSFGTDSKLAQAWGPTFGKGLPHGKDAARHLLVFLTTYAEGRMLGGQQILERLVMPYAPEGWNGKSVEPEAH